MKRRNLKTRMTAGILAMIFIITAVISALFLHTKQAMREAYMAQVDRSMEGVVKDIDAFAREIYAVSDSLSSNSQLDEFLDRSYHMPEELYVKRADTMRLYRQIISKNDILQQRQKPAAIYTEKGVLYNFRDANQDGAEVIAKLDALQVNSREHLMRFYWYPLQDNFMVSRHYDDPRKDKVMLGTRRVYSVWKADYVCTQIFCVQEKDLYDAYWESIVEPRGDIYILDRDGNLLSSSKVEAVQQGAMEEALREAVLKRENAQFTWRQGGAILQVSVQTSDVTGWQAVAVIPMEMITGDVDALYGRIFFVILLCMLFCCAMLWYLYQTFITPINALNEAMVEVYAGNLNAYVKESGWPEIADMMRYFNAMLRSINVHIVEKLEADKRKKQLELEVLMGQINPHFLYNTLENIVWKSNSAGHPEIGRMAAALGRMYRLSISDGKAIVPLRQEIEHLMAYVKIQQNRYGDSFVFELKVDAERVRQYQVIKILLQPIVENSFLYGMEGLERQMQIQLYMQEKQGYLRFFVIDNGNGMDKERLQKVREQIRFGRADEGQENRRSTGIGLHNVSERIRLYFGIENPVRIYSKKGIGTVTIVTVPSDCEALQKQKR